MDETINPTSVSKTVTPDFTGFSKLPMEIRFKIWELVSNQPRNIDIWQRRLGYFEEEWSQHLSQIARWMTLSAVPSILHVSRESRAIGLKFYQLAFGGEIRLSQGLTITNEPRIYFNWDEDRLVPMQAYKWGYEALDSLINTALAGMKIQKVAFRADHQDPGSWNFMVGRFDEILIYYDPFLFYDRLKSRSLTIKFEPIIGIDLISNKEKEALDKHIETIEEEERWNDEEVTRALAEGTPVPEKLKSHIIGSWKSPTVRLGRMVIHGRMSDTGSEDEIWTHAGWVPLSSASTILE